MKSILPPSRVRLRFTLFGLVLAGALTALAAAPADNATGARLLQAQLPGGTPLAQTACEPLARAVGRATLAHRPEASAILSAALSRRNRFSCACVARIFRVSLAAAPAQSSALLETASALYPDCADALAAALGGAGDKNAVDDKTVVDDKNGPRGARASSGAPQDENFDPNVRGLGETGPNDLTDRDVSGLGFGGGFGPDFPGSPGFTGSTASGGIALPPVAVTSVVNG